MSARPRIPRSRRNGAPVHPKPARQRGLGPGVFIAPVLGTTIIVTLAWAAALEQATPEVFAAASVAFALAEGIVLAFIGAAMSSRGLAWAIGLAVLTAILATPGRWQVAYLNTGQRPPLTDLGIDFGVTVAWAIFASLAGATVLRERLLTLLPPSASGR